LNCAFRDSSTMKGKFEAPEKCKEVNCIGMFKIRPRHSILFGVVKRKSLLVQL